MCTDNAPAVGGGADSPLNPSPLPSSVRGNNSGGPWENSGGLWGVSEGASGVLRGSSGGVLEGLWGIPGWGREDPP